jgi:putative phosphoesterase
MIVGIMSDSHDNLPAVKKAVRFFQEMKCRLVIHAGDFVAPFAARELGLLGCPVKSVFGNCDGEKRGLEKALHPFGEIKEAPFVFSHSGREILLVHVPFSIKKHSATRQYDVIIFGHTHKPKVEKKDGSLLINPGETGGWVSGKTTVAVLDTEIGEAEIVAL